MKERPRRDQIGRLKTIKWALYGRIGREHARSTHAPAQLTGSPHKVRKTRLNAKRHRTRDHGIAALVINDCAHLTALWVEVEAIADEGLAALAMCPSYATVAPTGGNKPLLGTTRLRSDGRGNRSRPMPSTSRHPSRHAVKSNFIGDPARNCPPVGQSMRREIKPLTRTLLCLAPCFHSADIRGRPSPQ